MTNAVNDKNLTRNKLRQLMAASGVDRKSSADVDAELFDWQKPHHFCPEALAMFDAFGKKLEKQVTKTFESLCHGQFDVKVTSTEECFADSLEAQIRAENPNHYFLPFEIGEDRQGGFMTISPQASRSLVGLMLRDQNFIEDAERQLSDLEDTLLMDISSSILEAFSFSLRSASGPLLKREKKFVKGDWPLVFSGMEDLFSITVTVSDEYNSIDIIFTIRSAAMEPVLGVIPETGSSQSEAQIRQIMMNNIQEANIRVEACLAQTMVALGDVMNLEPGDILLLGKKTIEPLDVLLNNRLCFKAFPARSRGKIALVLAPNIISRP